MVDSIATSLGTGSEPGRPRQTGQTWVLGSAPNPVGQPQNILVLVPSSTCVSRPMTGSNAATASSYDRCVTVLIMPAFSLGVSTRDIGYPSLTWRERRHAGAVSEEQEVRPVHFPLHAGRILLVELQAGPVVMELAEQEEPRGPARPVLVAAGQPGLSRSRASQRRW